MNLRFTEEQAMLGDSARRLLADQYDFARRPALLDSEEGFSRDLWREMAALGWLAVALPEADGGLGGDPADIAAIAQALGEVLAVEPVLSCAILAAGVLADLGDETQRALLGEVLEGRLLLALAHDEATEALDRDVAVTASPIPKGWLLQGAKPLVLGGASADVFLVSARVDDGVAVFTVPRDSKGLSISPVRLVDGTRAADLTLAAVAVSTNARLGNGNATEALERAADRAIIASCFEMIGGLGVLVQGTREHVETRVQFGRPLSGFQVVRQQLAGMAVALEEAKAIARLGALSLNADRYLRRRGVASAKAKVGRAARLVTTTAVQLHGGMGVTEELNVGAYLKRALTFDLLFGSAEVHERRLLQIVRSRPERFAEALTCAQERAA